MECLKAKYSAHLEKTYEEHIQNEKDVSDLLNRLLVDEEADISYLKRVYRCYYRNSTLLKYARDKFPKESIETLENRLRIARGKSHSGVLVITIFTSPHPEYTDSFGQKRQQAFSCKWNCAYCPNEPGQPRSYLLGEPGVLRANTHKFICTEQMWARMDALYNNGHPIDKLEVLVLGGTWESYPKEYRNEFIRDIYYAANTFWTRDQDRPKASLSLERDGNQNAECKIIGLTLETRPDTICENSIRTLRYYGCTRVQLGIQHLDDAILERVNRQCPTWKTVRAIRQLKQWGYKIDAHFMPCLPSAHAPSPSTPQTTLLQDTHMFLNQLLGMQKDPELIPSPIPNIHTWTRWYLSHPEFQVDQWKIYPCDVVPYTEIETWWKNGEYVLYSHDELFELLLQVKRAVFPWIRLNRVIRDIPGDYILASGEGQSNLRQALQMEMKKRGWVCRCIRCREIKRDKLPETIYYTVHEYEASGGTEYFISAENRVLCGFVRLRLEEGFPAYIRELHVYGLLAPVETKKGNETVQNRKIGSTLMGLAENIARVKGYRVMKVIAGEGTRQYYAKLGYSDEGELGMGFMTKVLLD